jgi:mono/diheme cytochrome c family protein
MRLARFCVLFALACGGPTDPGGGSGGGDTSGTGGGGGGMDTANHNVDVSSLPCDVSVAVSNSCASCHGAPPNDGAIVTLLSRNDFLATPPGDMHITVGEISSVLMQSTGSDVMPPASQPASPTDLHAITAWVAAGMLPGSCDGSPPPPTTCPSGTHWAYGNSGSPVMNPGLACINCHTSMQPREKFTAGGTVFTDLHTEDLCNGGSKSGGTVEIIGDDGVVTTLSVNSAGNFYTFANIKLPYTARVTYMGNVRSMTTAQAVGDCNSCHTAQGASGAPGRIIWPD